MKEPLSCTAVCVAAFVTGLLLFFSFAALPTPMTNDEAAQVFGTRTTSPDYNTTEAWKALHFCKSAYCPVASVTNWTCGNACSNATPNFHIYNIYENTSTGNVGYSGMDHDSERIVVAFRGTFNTANWIQDLDFWSMPYPHPGCGPSCTIHRGFYKAYDSVRPQLIQDVLAMHTRYPTYSLFITGHSLGGAMAVLAAIEFTTWNLPKAPEALADGVRGRHAAPEPSHLVPVELYTFGEPRVGNVFFTNWSTSVLENERQFRVTHAKDPVPHLPPRSWGYVHVPQEHWYPTDNDTVLLCQDNSTTEDAQCSNSVYATAVADHLLYLGICTRCECTAAVMEEIHSYRLSPELYGLLALEYTLDNGHPPQP
ncbi:lipase [Novymonas esmeraldas]|uniref:Lipase n=1 Tax=Novymonas esmeraldas TaxID=1808958 RepID=A0AAW0F6R4_9TRYP